MKVILVSVTSQKKSIYKLWKVMSIALVSVEELDSVKDAPVHSASLHQWREDKHPHVFWLMEPRLVIYKDRGSSNLQSYIFLLPFKKPIFSLYIGQR